MARKPNYFRQAMTALEELHAKYPQFGMGRHLSMALGEYGDVWGLTDREIHFALEKYKAELELDEDHIADDEYVDQIVKDGMALSTSKTEEEDDSEWGVD